MKTTVTIEVALDLADGTRATFALTEPREHGNNPAYFANQAEADMVDTVSKIKQLLEARYGVLPEKIHLSRVLT